MKRTAIKLRIRLLKRARRVWPRFAGPALPTKSDIKSIWLSRRAITAVVRLPGMKGFDRPLAWILGLPPRFLSNRVERPTYRLPGGLRIQLRHWLWKQRAVSHCAVLVLLIALALVTLSWSVGSAWNTFDGGDTSPIPDASLGMLAVVGYAGAMFGFLLVVLTFAAQLRWAGGVTLQPVTGFVARQYYAFETIAVTGGLAVANIVVAHGSALLGTEGIGAETSDMSKILGTMLGINLVLAPIVTALSIRLFAKIFTVAASGDVAAIMPAIESTAAEALTQSDWMCRRAEAFVNALEPMGLDYDMMAHSTLPGRHSQRLNTITGVSGRLVDVDMVMLESVGKYAREIASDARVAIPIVLGQAWSDDNGAVVVLPASGDGSKSSIDDPALLQRLSRTLRGSLCLESAREHASITELRQLQEAIGTGLEVLARDKRHVEMESLFNALAAFLDSWLDVIHTDAEPPVLQILSPLDIYCGPLEVDLRGPAATAAASGDENLIEVVINSVSRLAVRCMNRNQYRLMRHYLDTLSYTYYRCGANDECMAFAGKRLDERLDSLMNASTSSSWSDRMVNMELLKSVLRFALSLVHAAIYLKQPVHAGHYVECILKRGGKSGVIPAGVPRHPIEQDQYSLIDYVAILLLGWAIDTWRSAGPSHRDAAKCVFNSVCQHLPPRERLIAIWELYRDSENDEADIDARLGVSNWDIRHWTQEYRAGQTIVRAGWRVEWQRDGFRAALLLSDEHYWGDFHALCPGVPSSNFWSANTEREALADLAQLDLLGIPEGQRQSRIDVAMNLMNQREWAARSSYLRRVLESALSADAIAKLEKESKQKWSDARLWIHALRRNLTQASDMPRMCPVSFPVYCRYSREELIDPARWITGFGKHLGYDAAIHESARLIALLERHAPSGEHVRSLAELPESVRSAVETLRERGYSPDTLVVPQEHRFTGALFRKPHWEIERVEAYGEASVGDWEDLLVLLCPYHGSKAILLLDSTSLLADNDISHRDKPCVVIHDPPDDPSERARRESARTAIESPGSELPSAGSINVLAQMTVHPDLGVRDLQAMLKLSLENSDGCYAILTDSEFYHRPSCPEIQHLSPEYVLRVPHDRSLKPCSACKPERWNHEGRRGLIDGETDHESSSDHLPDVT